MPFCLPQSATPPSEENKEPLLTLNSVRGEKKKSRNKNVGEEGVRRVVRGGGGAPFPHSSLLPLSPLRPEYETRKKEGGRGGDPSGKAGFPFRSLGQTGVRCGFRQKEATVQEHVIL